MDDGSAKADPNTEAIHDLQLIAPYAQYGTSITVDAILTQRKWLNYYGGAAWRRNGGDFEASLYKLSPEYTDEDVRKAFEAQPAVTKALLPEVLMTDLSTIKKLKVPLILLSVVTTTQYQAQWLPHASGLLKHHRRSWCGSKDRAI
jgi:proline iminopeptidase